MADVPTVRFSPNGRAVAAIGSRGTVRGWSVDVDHVAEDVCRLSRDHHWDRLLPDRPVAEACPS
ncbi:hypothetical protein [Streptomyces sp. NPDC087300]|uniref:hypothetical protein n=1 Tax=Streptomyces sp. NPDC087300 TaxID=3365780 RepID=UPI003804F629